MTEPRVLVMGSEWELDLGGMCYISLDVVKGGALEIEVSEDERTVTLAIPAPHVMEALAFVANAHMLEIDGRHEANEIERTKAHKGPALQLQIQALLDECEFNPDVTHPLLAERIIELVNEAISPIEV